MSGYLFIIVLVTLSTQQLNTIALTVSTKVLDTVDLDLTLLPKVRKPYHTYDNECTGITPAASAYDTIGRHDVYYSQFEHDRMCHRYINTWKKDHFYREFLDTVNHGHVSYISYENPLRPGEMQDYPDGSEITSTSEPYTITVIVAYKKDVGFGLVECPAKNRFAVWNGYVVGYRNRSVKTSDIDAIKDEVAKYTGPIVLFPAHRRACAALTGDRS
ncbi:hypothetical protein CHUAL_000181 [Chamberlinius hualienensis]